MKFCAIICEYNPFHNGHLYQIQKAKELSGCDGIICIMGGNFNQRGLPCIFDKHTRAKLAIENGADIVVELPTSFATQSAEIFALSSIKIIKSFKNITHVCFGSECGNIKALTEIANYLMKPDVKFKKKFKENLKLGLSYAKCIEQSIENNDWIDIISKPNNLLAIEYLKAIKRTKSFITPITIKREDNYNSDTGLEFLSASAIRNSVLENKIDNIKNFIPENIANILPTSSSLNIELFNKLCEYNLKIKNEKITDIFEISEGIENYLKKSFTPTSRYKINKINRTKLNVVLNIKKSVIKKLYKIKLLPYIKLLAGRKDCLKFLECKSILIIRKNDIKIKNRYFCELEKIDNNSNILYNFIANTTLSESSLYEPPILM